VSVHTIQGPAGIVAGAGLEPATTGSMKPVSCHCYTRRADRAGVEPAEHDHGFHAASHGCNWGYANPAIDPPIVTCLKALARPYPCQCCPHSNFPNVINSHGAPPFMNWGLAARRYHGSLTCRLDVSTRPSSCLTHASTVTCSGGVASSM
jgi:hypothetical protein